MSSPPPRNAAAAAAAAAAARAAADEDEEADPSSITDVFANMLEINEDLLAVAAECHADEDAEGSIAYQRLLHLNLMEMANFIDSCFGVYTKSEDGDDTSSLEGASDAPELVLNEELLVAGAGDTADGLAPLVINDAVATAITRRLEEQEEQEEIEAEAAPGDVAKPEPSALLATLEADEAAKVKQRSKKQWIRSREQIIEQETASAGLNEAAKRMATVTAGMMKAPAVPVLPPAAPLLPIRLPLPLVAPPALVPAPASTEAQASASTPSPPTADSECAALATPSPAPSASGSAPTDAPMPPPPQSTDMPAAPTPPAPLMPDNAVPFFAPPLGGFAPYLPITGPKIALPSTHSLVSVLYPVAASVYPPIQLSTTCPTCALQGRRAHECRLVLKHVSPPLLFDPISVPGIGLIQWPPPPPPPPPPLDATPAVPSRQMIAKSLKRMCEECRKCHFSVHRCRIVLQHTAPEWQPAASAPAAPRRRKTGASRKSGGAKQVS